MFEGEAARVHHIGWRHGSRLKLGLTIPRRRCSSMLTL
jgi:hypothetical protein